MRSEHDPIYCMYLAVLPVYRQAVFELLEVEHGANLRVLIGDAHLNPSVRSGIQHVPHQRVRVLRIGRIAFVQFGHWWIAIRAKVLIADLNPRSLTAWLLIITRRMLRRRTLVWGHLYPQGGANTSRGGARILMRRIATGFIAYTYTQATVAEAEMPDRQVFVAPNSLYRRDQILAALASHSDRDVVLFTGRLEPEKKPLLLVNGFLRSGLAEQGARLVFIGSGILESQIRQLIRDAKAEQCILLEGEIHDFSELTAYYARAFCTVSTGFAGLGLTQSLGFGVPMLIAEDEPHSPEIELADRGGVRFFKSDSADALADALRAAHADRVEDEKTRHVWARDVAERYSAERMAAGLSAALLDGRQAMRQESHG